MRLIYLAHPVAGDVRANLSRAKYIYAHLTKTFSPAIAIVAPWITECELWDDADPRERQEGLLRCVAVARRCDELWLTGGRVTASMRLEAEAAEKEGVKVKDFGFTAESIGWTGESWWVDE